MKTKSYMIDIIRNNIEELEIATATTIVKEVNRSVESVGDRQEHEIIGEGQGLSYHLLTLVELGEVTVTPRDTEAGRSAYYVWAGSEKETL
tara:strand:- start:13129 stop:13401 length:273 start_codon:yes stop_codon:yes gene_type:complete